MPKVYAERSDVSYEPVNVDVNEFISMCDEKETQEVIERLLENGDITDDFLMSHDRSQIDSTFKLNLLSLRNKWYMLSQEDEETINKIANKYK